MLSFNGPASLSGPSEPTTRTTQPIVTGTSVLAIKYIDGVMMVADTLASYGNLARFKGVKRIHQFGTDSLLGFSGEMSDMQSILETLETSFLEDINQDDGYVKGPSELYNYLRTVMYNRRSKGSPLWNQILVAGFRDNASFLGYVDLIGTAYEEDFIATGFGAYLAIPVIREKWRPDMEEGEARALLEDCMRVLFYRDCKASNHIILSKVTQDGSLVSEPYSLSHDWETANYDLRHPSVGDSSSW